MAVDVDFRSDLQWDGLLLLPSINGAW